MKVSVQLRFLCTTALGWAGELLSSFYPPFRFIYIYSLGISNKYRWMSERVSRSFLSSGLYTANISDVVSTNNCLLSTFKRFPLIRISYLPKGQNEFMMSSIFQISNSKIWRISALKVLKLNISRYRMIWPEFFCIFNLGLPCVLKVIGTNFWLSFKIFGQKSLKFFELLIWKIDDIINSIWLYLTFNRVAHNQPKI